MVPKKILIFGCGVIGGNVLDLLTRMPEPYEIYIAARHVESIKQRVNLAIAVAMNLGFRPKVAFFAADLMNVERTAELIVKIKPDIIVNASSLQTFWLISTLPDRYYRPLEKTGLGPWLPNHLAPARRLMLAVRMSDFKAPVVNVAFPDAVNPVLDKVGLAPYIGAGNIGNTIPTLKRAIAHILSVALESIDVRFVAYHYLGNHVASHGDTGGAPYHLSIYLNGEDATHLLQPEEMFQLFVTLFKRTRGVPGQIMASSSAVAIIRAISIGNSELLHAPGPRGLAGGYPVRLDAHKLELALPDRLTLSDAISINEKGQVYEGIEQIKPDGTVIFAEPNMQILKRYLGYECQQMRLDDVDEWAGELQAKYKAFSSNLETL